MRKLRSQFSAKHTLVGFKVFLSDWDSM